MKQIDLNKYKEFVDAVTSDQSKNNEVFVDNWNELNKDVDMPRLLTASCGLGAEAGEFTEIVKKCMFQGKPMTDENKYHMKRELGDVMWYVMQCLIALDTPIEEVIDMNVEKLKKRYPGGEFDPYYSEHRQEGDL